MTLVEQTGVQLRRALFSIDPRQSSSLEVDVLVVGSGIAGLTVATSLPAGCSVALVTKGPLGDGSTRHAQGGVAAAIGADDNPDLHLADTIVAGSGLCDDDAVRVLVDDAAGAIEFLERSGLSFDHEGPARALTREGGHSRSRVVHAGGDATGAAIARALVDSVRALSITILEAHFVADLVRDEAGRVAGAVLIGPRGVRVVRANTVVLATGGYGQLFAETTAPAACTGDGAAAALRAGAALCDLEFVQFHPTTLHVASDPRPLLSEAMRGEGARLVDRDGRSVTEGVHRLGDLAPRDIVSRAIAARMAELGDDHVLLDATGLGAATLARRFPTIVATCRSFGIDPVTTPIPVSPAAHYTMGGIGTDLDGRSSLEGLFAVGEVAASGVHGANRLASNSLLEGVVFGRRVADAILGSSSVPRALVPLETRTSDAAFRGDEGRRAWLRRTMVDRAGVVRTGEGIEGLGADLTARLGGAIDDSVVGYETENMLELATALALMAAARKESRGAHFRTDHPAEVARWRRRQRCSLAEDGTVEIRRGPVGEVPAGESAEVHGGEVAAAS